MTPIERAQATLANLLLPQATPRRPISTPVTFWTISRSERDCRGIGCASGLDVSLTLFGPAAGLVRIPCADGEFLPETADDAALAEFEAEVAEMLAGGYAEQSATRGPRVMRWVGTRQSAFAEGGVTTGVIEARRGADRPDDEAIIALGALLRERKPQLADIRSAA